MSLLEKSHHTAPNRPDTGSLWGGDGGVVERDRESDGQEKERQMGAET